MIDTAAEKKIVFGLNSLWWKGWDPINWFYHTSWVAVVTPTDGPKSVRNCCVIKVFGGVFVLSSCHRTESDLFLFLLDPVSWLSVMAVSGTLPLVLELREESHLPSFLLSRLWKVSYLAVSVRLTVKQVLVNECIVQYDWSMIFKGPIKWCNT